MELTIFTRIRIGRIRTILDFGTVQFRTLLVFLTNAKGAVSFAIVR